MEACINRLIKETHSILMEGVRGSDKNPGEFRISQNWIGAAGSTLKTARYIPPNPEDMAEAMSDLEKYFHAEDTQDVLIRAAMIHYQFETIHPFLDGNGRLGRLLITLFLTEQGALQTPALYMSFYLKKNRIEYYDRVSEVRNKDNYEQWVKFFLRAVQSSAEDASKTIRELSLLHDRNMNAIDKMGRAAKTAKVLFSYLEQNPIIDIRKTAEALKLSFSTVSGAVKRLEEIKILFQTNNAERNRVFAYREYLDILRKDT